MIPPLLIDTTVLYEDYSFTRKDVEGLMNYVAQEVAGTFTRLWIKEASSKLNSSRQIYIDSIATTNPANGVTVVELLNDLPNMIEMGAGSWDMKPVMLASNKVKVNENGVKFITIPFTWGVPTSLAENFSNIMPNEVYQAVKTLPFEIKTSGGVRTAGLKEEDIPEKFRDKPKKVVPIPNSKSFSIYQYKSSIYQGIQRQKSNVTKQSSYVSFRRISENSDENSWIHPGFQASNLAESAMQNLNIPFEMGKAIDGYLVTFGFENE